MNLPERVRLLEVTINGPVAGVLRHASQFTFAYSRDEPGQRPVGLLMGPEQLEFSDTALFPVMDQNLPEGYLLARIRDMFPKQPVKPMHLLALIGTNGIGQLGFQLPDAEPARVRHHISRQEILSAEADVNLFEQLVAAYLSTGVGVSGVQPKILVPDRATWAVPNLIVKSASPTYPGLAANEFACLEAARLAGITVPAHELSQSGELLVLERFDLLPDGSRLGFEDIAALMGLQVRDVLSDRKYHGSYEGVAEVLKVIGLHRELPRFFEQVAFSIMVRNGDAHLKNFGVLYTSAADAQLAPMFDVVTTAMYQYERFAGGPPAEDHTMALKLFKGKGSRVYPSTAQLLRFGHEICRVQEPERVVERIAEGMAAALQLLKDDARLGGELLARLGEYWARGFDYAREAQVSKSLGRRVAADVQDARDSRASPIVADGEDSDPLPAPRP